MDGITVFTKIMDLIAEETKTMKQLSIEVGFTLEETSKVSTTFMSIGTRSSVTLFHVRRARPRSTASRCRPIW